MLEVLKFLKVEAWPKTGLALPVLQAHRGYWLDGAKENTMAAFHAARKMGVQMFEFDVRLSCDDIPVVFHDPHLELDSRFGKSVEDLTARELQALTGAPLLEEVLADPGVPHFFNIELKSQKSLRRPIEKKAVELVRKYNLQSRVLFSSFNPYYILRLSKLAPEIPRALLVTNENAPGNFFFIRRMWLAPFLKFHILHLNHKMLNESIIRKLVERKIPVAVWTVNEPKEIQEFLSWGCRSVISDSLSFPEVLKV